MFALSNKSFLWCGLPEKRLRFPPVRLLRGDQEVGHKTVKKFDISTTGKYFGGGLFYFYILFYGCVLLYCISYVLTLTGKVKEITQHS